MCLSKALILIKLLYTHTPKIKRVRSEQKKLYARMILDTTNIIPMDIKNYANFY